MNNYTAPSESVDIWYSHFKDLADGKLEPDINGLYVLGSKRKGAKSQFGAKIEIVTPAANIEKVAQSDIKNSDKQPSDSDPISHFPEDLSHKGQTVVKKRKYNKKGETSSKKKVTHSWKKFV